MSEAGGPPVVIVSGLPRSGTSMMMRMIAAAGVPVLADLHRPADDDNPLGYYELEAARATRNDPSWLTEAPGRVVKLVHVLLPELPPHYQYRVVMMNRDLDEVLESQRKMLARSGRAGAAISPEALKRTFASQLDGVRRWVGSQSNFRLLTVEYRDVIANPRGQAGRVAEFLSLPGGAQTAERMAAAVDPTLYRNRA